MIAEIKLGIDSVKASLDLLKTVKNVTEKAEIDAALYTVREHLADLQERLLNAQQVTDLILEERRQAVRDLEDERSKNSRLECYTLIEPRSGVFLYAYQPAENDKTPIHTACPKCFSEKTVSILQKPDPTSSKTECPLCKFHYDPRTAEEIKSVYAQLAAMKPMVRGRNPRSFL